MCAEEPVTERMVREARCVTGTGHPPADVVPLDFDEDGAPVAGICCRCGLEAGGSQWSRMLGEGSSW